jgi:hypothetical protein
MEKNSPLQSFGRLFAGMPGTLTYRQLQAASFRTGCITSPKTDVIVASNAFSPLIKTFLSGAAGNRTRSFNPLTSGNRPARRL